MARGSAAGDAEIAALVARLTPGEHYEISPDRKAVSLTDAGIDPSRRIVVVTDPGSPLEEDARSKGQRVVTADPDVGGRYSALTAFGLVPAGLAGVDVEVLLDDAESVTDLLADDDEANPALRLGAAIGGTSPLRDKLYLVDHGTELVGFGDWAEQLIAESTGKDGTGLLPVVLPRPGGSTPPTDATIVRLVPDDGDDSAPVAASTVDVGGSLGAQFLLWEVATAVAGRLLGINPFDQPDVEAAKAGARDMLESGLGGEAEEPAFLDGDIAVFGTAELLDGADSLEDALRVLRSTW